MTTVKTVSFRTTWVSDIAKDSVSFLMNGAAVVVYQHARKVTIVLKDSVKQRLFGLSELQLSKMLGVEISEVEFIEACSDQSHDAFLLLSSVGRRLADYHLIKFRPVEWNFEQASYVGEKLREFLDS